MGDITIDTNDVQYQQLLSGIGVLRTVLTPRVKILKDLSRAQQRWWLQRDPLLREFIKMVRDFNAAMEIAE